MSENMAASGTDQGAGSTSASEAPVESTSQGDTSSTGTEDQAGSGEGAPPPQETPEPDDDSQLLTRSEIEALRNDPVALQKALQRAFTQKTQNLAPYARLIQELNRDARGTVIALAKQFGVPIAETAAESAVRTGQQNAQSARDTIMANLEAAFGPEGAQALMPVLNHLVEQSVTPIRQQLEQTQAMSVTSEIQSTLDRFTEKHPDWKKYEPKMYEIGKAFQLDPASGVSADSYMEYLFRLAKSEQDVSNEAAALLKRQQASASASEPRSRSTSAAAVSAPPKGPVGLRESIQLAMAGKVVGQ